MEKKSKNTSVNVRITEDVRKKLQELADKDRRTLSDYIRTQLEILVEKKK